MAGYQDTSHEIWTCVLKVCIPMFRIVPSPDTVHHTSNLNLNAGGIFHFLRSSERDLNQGADHSWWHGLDLGLSCTTERASSVGKIFPTKQSKGKLQLMGTQRQQQRLIIQ